MSSFYYSDLKRPYNNTGRNHLANMEGIMYECIKCGSQFDGKELSLRNQIKCPQCGYRVIKKVRPPIVKRVKAI